MPSNQEKAKSLKKRQEAMAKKSATDDVRAEYKRRTSRSGIVTNTDAFRFRSASKAEKKKVERALSKDDIVMAAMRNTSRVRANSIKQEYTPTRSVAKKRSSAVMDMLDTPSKRRLTNTTASISSECGKVGAPKFGPLTPRKKTSTGREKLRK